MKLYILSLLTGVRTDIAQLKNMFVSLRNATREELEKAGISTDTLLDTLYDLPIANKKQHREFLMKYKKHFEDCENIRSIFRNLSTYWNYMNIDILAHLITQFSLHCLYMQLKAYEEKLEQFMERTTLQEYYEVEADKEQKEAPKGFSKLVSKHNWKPPTYLKTVDEFRRRFARKYNLHACAVILVSMNIGSVVITMMVPESVAAMVKSTGAEFFKKQGIIDLQLNGTCVYEQASRPPIVIHVAITTTSYCISSLTHCFHALHAD